MKNVQCKNCANYINEWCNKIVDSPCPDLERNCNYYCDRTYYYDIKNMNIDQMAEFLVQKVGWDCRNCSENKRMRNVIFSTDKLFSVDISCDDKCEFHCKEWLQEISWK